MPTHDGICRRPTNNVDVKTDRNIRYLRYLICRTFIPEINRCITHSVSDSLDNLRNPEIIDVVCGDHLKASFLIMTNIFKSLFRVSQLASLRHKSGRAHSKFAPNTGMYTGIVCKQTLLSGYVEESSVCNTGLLCIRARVPRPRV
jgi:hypothetical protein